MKSLFALSGNLCAYPGCAHELVSTMGVPVAQICHIEAANEGGPRFNPLRSDEYLRSHENLIVLCYKHHKITDDERQYSVETLKKFKSDHEIRQGKKQFKIDEASLYQFERDVVTYWSEVRRVNQDEHVHPEFSVEIPVGRSPIEIFQRIYELLSFISESVELLRESDAKLNNEIRRHLAEIGYDLGVYDNIFRHTNPFTNRWWEVHNLALPNALTDMYYSVLTGEARFHEEFLKTNMSNPEVSRRLEQIRTELLEAARFAAKAD